MKLLLGSLGRKPATTSYPVEKAVMPDRFRAKLVFTPEKCIGCRLCMRDCPSRAIEIKKVGEKRFECVIRLDRCIYCAQCVDTCPKKALAITPEFELAQLDRSRLQVVYSPAPASNASTETVEPQRTPAP